MTKMVTDPTNSSLTQPGTSKEKQNVSSATSTSEQPKSSTPDVTFAQRELKKLEDYWTRQNPVQEDSPRLRSNRRVNFAVRECLRNGRRSDRNTPESKTPVNTSTPVSAKDSEETFKYEKEDITESFPESPIPNIKKAHLKSQSLSTKSDHIKVAKEKSNDDYKQELVQQIKRKRSCTLTCNNQRTTRHALSLVTKTPDILENKAQVIHLSEKKDCTISTEKISINTDSPQNLVCTPDDKDDDEDDDDDDDDYIPPRKKLRSEVKNDELWDGIPLDVTFKRLAPKTKNASDPVQDAVDNTDNCDAIPKEKLMEGGIDSSITQENPQSISNETSIAVFQSNDAKTYTDSSTRSVQKEFYRKEAITSESEKASPEFLHDKQQIVKCTCKMEQAESPKKANRSLVDDNKVMTPDNLIHKSVSEILACASETVTSETGKDGHPIIAAESIEDDDTRHTMLDGSDNEENNMTLRNVFELSSMLESVNDDTLPYENMADTTAEQNVTNKPKIESDRKSESVNGTPRRRSARLLNLEEMSRNDAPLKLEKGKRILNNNLEEAKEKTDEHGVIGKTGNEMTVAETYDIVETDTDDVYTELEVQGSDDENTDESENEGKEMELDSPTVSTSLENASKQILSMFTKTKTKSKVLPPLRIKLKQPFKCTLNKSEKTKLGFTSGETAEGKSKVTTKCKLKIKVKVPANNNKVKKNDEKNTPKPRPSNAQSTSGKRGYTPKKMPVKKNKTTQRKYSPPCNMELRLNNERRQSALTDMLSNTVLNKHACVLWSSENRRHVQLSHPGASSAELDAILSKKWDNLCSKEKIRFFQRARDALRDENRHSNKRFNQDTSVKSQPPELSSLDKFCGLSPTVQMAELKRWLSFYNEVSPDQCVSVMNEFKGQLSRERQEKERLEKEQLKKLSKAKRARLKRKQKQDHINDNDAKHRRMLYEMIQNKKENILEILSNKRQTQQQLLQTKYSCMVRRIIDGDVISFSGDVTSCRLTEVLADIRALEKNAKVAVIGNILTDEELEHIQTRLKKVDWTPDKCNVLETLEDKDIDSTVVEEKAKLVSEIPCLSPRTVLAHLPNTPSDSLKSTSETIRQLSTSDKKLAKRSPSFVLTDWVADDILRHDGLIEYRSARSLLSNKVVQSPTCVLPKAARRIIDVTPMTQGPKPGTSGVKPDSAAGLTYTTNQTCTKVVYTKLVTSQTPGTSISSCKPQAALHGLNKK